MKRFRFRLQQLLKLREQRKREAELRQQRAQIELRTACANVLTIEEQLAQAAASLQRHEGRPSSVGLWINGSLHAVRVNESLKAAREKVRRAEQQLHNANQQRVVATTQTESLVSLRARQWAEHQQDEASRVQRQMDEGAMRRWSEASRGGSEDETVVP